MRTGREVHVASRPTGSPTRDDFRLVETQAPGPGDIVLHGLVRLSW
jgi:hypothetical protein